MTEEQKIHIQKMKRRNRAIWYMYIKAQLSLQDIADMIGISRQRVHQILKKTAKEKKEDLEVYNR